MLPQPHKRFLRQLHGNLCCCGVPRRAGELAWLQMPSVLFARQIMLSAEVPLLPRGTTSASALGVAFDYFIVEAFCPVPDLLRP